MFRRLLLYSVLFAAIVAGCGGSNNPPPVQGQVVTPNTTQLQVSVVTLAAPGINPQSVSAQSLADIDHFVVEIEGQEPQTLSPDGLRLLSGVINLIGASPGPVEVTIRAQDAQDQTLAYYQATVEVPGELLVHLGRFQIGDGPVELGDVGEWVEISDAPLGLSGLDEKIWEAAVPLPDGSPRSPYDIIGLHRITGDTTDPEKVLLYLPGANANGGTFTDDEDRDLRLYLANRGYDVFSLDYRTHYVPPFNVPGLGIPPLATDGLAFMGKWNSETYVSDVARAIEKVKEETGAEKIFLAGFSSGGQFAVFYAASEQGDGLGQDNLQGLISLDGGPWQIRGDAPLGTLELEPARAADAEGDTPANRALLQTYGCNPGPDYYSNGFGDVDLPIVVNLLAYILDPDAPTTQPGFDSAADYLVFRIQNAWTVNEIGDGQLTNIQRGYNTLDMMLVFLVLDTDTYWPVIQDLEDSALSNNIGNLDGPFTLPVLPGDTYLEHLPEVTIPMLAFGSTGLDSFVGTRISWKFAGLEMSGSADTTAILVEHFGHLDLVCGTKITEFVSEPLLEWLESHSQ